MEADRNPLPEKMPLFWTPAIVGRVGRAIGSLVRHLPDVGYPSDRSFDNSPLNEPVFKQQSFEYDSEGNWHNPAPDIAGRDL